MPNCHWFCHGFLFVECLLIYFAVTWVVTLVAQTSRNATAMSFDIQNRNQLVKLWLLKLFINDEKFLSRMQIHTGLLLYSLSFSWFLIHDWPTRFFNSNPFFLFSLQDFEVFRNIDPREYIYKMWNFGPKLTENLRKFSEVWRKCLIFCSKTWGQYLKMLFRVCLLHFNFTCFSLVADCK